VQAAVVPVNSWHLVLLLFLLPQNQLLLVEAALDGKLEHLLVYLLHYFN
jgi:hypothetical protein